MNVTQSESHVRTFVVGMENQDVRDAIVAYLGIQLGLDPKSTAVTIAADVGTLPDGHVTATARILVDLGAVEPAGTRSPLTSGSDAIVIPPVTLPLDTANTGAAPAVELASGSSEQVSVTPAPPVVSVPVSGFAIPR